MGVRFRKTVKISKGVKVNISKSGLSLSVGGAGHSVNFRNGGVKGTVGIPGTGLSYSQQIIHKNASPSQPKATSGAFTGVFSLRMDLDGNITIWNEQGIQITDPTILKKIKSTVPFQKQKAALEARRQKDMEEMINQSAEELAQLIDLYKLSPTVGCEEDYQDALARIVPEIYRRREFTTPAPNENDILETLKKEAVETVTGNIFVIDRKRRKYVQDNFGNRLQEKIQEWENDKAAFNREEDSNEEAQNAAYAAECATEKEYLSKLIAGNSDILCNEIEAWIASCVLPVEIEISYEWDASTGTVLLDVDLPEVEDIPETEIVRLQSGNIKEKKKSQAVIREQYATMVCGLAILICSSIFNISPAIHNTIVSGYTQRRNREGDIQDDYIYSVQFRREQFERVNIEEIEPVAFCQKATSRINLTTTKIFKTIVPFEFLGEV